MNYLKHLTPKELIFYYTLLRGIRMNNDRSLKYNTLANILRRTSAYQEYRQRNTKAHNIRAGFLNQ